MATEPFVILVDKNDHETGTMEKREAHLKGLIHRAISVFITNTKGEWLLQRRAINKYHSQGLWTNTCCSHPFPGETNMNAARRRLMEEMGLEGNLYYLFSFIYKEKLDNELTEHELDHVFHGISDDLPVINDKEAMEWKYVPYPELLTDIRNNPDKYTVWFKKIFGKVYQLITNA